MTFVAAFAIRDVADLLGAIAWPLVALAIALIFRAPLRALLGRDDVEISGPGGISVTAKGREAAATALVQASTSKDEGPVERKVAEAGVEAAAQGVEVLGRPPQILWVDDQPSNNRYEVAALTSLGMHVQLSTSTEDALQKVSSHGPYDVIISDMGRPPDRKAGYTLLDALRRLRNRTPFVIYASSRSAEHFDAAVARGAVGCTNQPDELIEMVSNALRSHTR
jgi:CheY-like chemotaxis protein